MVKSKLKAFMCIHKYSELLTKSNFYGRAVLSECLKCGKQKVGVTGWPELGKDSKYIHHNEVE